MKFLHLKKYLFTFKKEFLREQFLSVLGSGRLGVGSIILTGMNPMKVVIAYLIFCLAGLVGCKLLGGGEDPPAIPGKIVFAARDDSENPTYQIFTMNADGSNVRQLTDDEFFCVSPAWSSDGQRIAFASNRQATVGSTTLWVMDTDGDNLQPLVLHPQTGRAMFGNHPAWSPDGTKLAFDYCVNCELGGGNEEVFLANLQDGTLDTLVQHPASDSYPAWSPDGTHLLFSSDRACDRSPLCSDIYSISAEGKNLKRITFSSESSKSAGGENWLSSDSISYILYDRNSQLRDLIIHDLESGKQQPVLLNLQAHQFWTFWDPARWQFLSIEKKHNEVPVTLTLFDLDGQTIEKIMLTNIVLKSANGFKWKRKL